MKKIVSLSFFLLFSVLFSNLLKAQPIIIDHNCAKLEPIPANAILQAKDQLHIAYGHTSHGSQLITGMTALVGQTDLYGYKGDIYEWNEGGTDGALDIDDYFMPGDLGHNGDTQWAEDTRTYLNNPENSDVNVVIWSWCGGCSDNTYDGIQTYLDTMNQLEIDYPDVQFVYMTGHTDIWNDSTLKANNQHIRDYCIANDKILYDFADIERYDPDQTYFEFVNDNCDYYEQAGSGYLGNWAIEWQNSHTEGVDWYDCSPAHTEALNGNLKAYAAWWLWCRLSGWDGGTSTNDIQHNNLCNISPNPASDKVKLEYNVNKPSYVQMHLTDIYGRIIKSSDFKHNKKGKYSKYFYLNSLPDGIYFIKLIIDGKKVTKKLVCRH